MRGAGIGLIAMIFCALLVKFMDKFFPQVRVEEADEDGRFFSSYLPSNVKSKREAEVNSSEKGP